VASVKYESSSCAGVTESMNNFLPLNWGRVVGRTEMTLDVRSPACGDTDVCENGGELIRAVKAETCSCLV